MPTHDATIVRSSARPLHMRTRRDLIFSRRGSVRGERWLVKDPVSLRYVSLTSHEYFVLQQLRAPIALEELKERLEQRFFPRQTTIQEIQSVAALLHRRGLIVSDALGQGGTLFERAREKKVAQRWMTLTNPLFIRLPGEGVVEGVTT